MLDCLQKVIYAHGVHTGGGITLLKAVFDEIGGADGYQLILDERSKKNLKDYSFGNVEYFPPGLIGRLKSEIWLRKNAKNIKSVLSFNSLPFLLRVPIQTIIFFQNVNFISPIEKLAPLSFVKSFLFKRGARSVSKFLVQTVSVGGKLSQVTDRPFEVVTLLDKSMLNGGIDAKLEGKPRAANMKFAYVADSAAHKNHTRLLEAWALLHNHFPGLDVELQLTLPEVENGVWSKLKMRFDIHSLSVSNCGTVPRERIFDLYARSDALVFPSLHESLGLPLLEAAQSELDVIASERDYVRDIINPIETFDPQSSISIARAIARYLGLQWPSATRPMSAQQLLRKVFNE